MGDPEFHEIEDQLFDAIVDSGHRAVIKGGMIYLLDLNGQGFEGGLMRLLNCCHTGR
jgi:hypothetical protein